mmetsp:Transcript_59981/g.118996  ORF Transcript_59981/g.118996 Transcript_59981/m.118996 type:complete len:208 (-) Transcript_59981:2125-2748(-)
MVRLGLAALSAAVRVRSQGPMSFTFSEQGASGGGSSGCASSANRSCSACAVWSASSNIMQQASSALLLGKASTKSGSPKIPTGKNVDSVELTPKVEPVADVKSKNDVSCTLVQDLECPMVLRPMLDLPSSPTGNDKADSGLVDKALLESRPSIMAATALAVSIAFAPRLLKSCQRLGSVKFGSTRRTGVMPISTEPQFDTSCTCIDM